MDKRKLRLHLCFIKNYKKNTLAVFFSFVLAFMLLTVMLVLLHTNHRVANIQDKMYYTPSDCYIENLSEKQIFYLRKDKDISNISLTVYYKHGTSDYVRNNQRLFMDEGDFSYITMMSKVIEGRMPEHYGEVVAEKWVFLNLGLEPEIGKTFTIKNHDTNKPEKVKLVGILSDMLASKRVGLIKLYTAFKNQYSGNYITYLRFKDEINYDKKIKSLIKELGINKKQISKCPGREDFRGLYKTDTKVAGVIIFLCMVVFYGVYRIELVTRKQQYGILRAIGMKKKELLKMLLAGLYQIYLVSIPVGIMTGLLISFFVIKISGDMELKIYFYNEKVKFVPVIPVVQLMASIIVLTVLVGLTGYMAGKKIITGSVIDIISETRTGGTGKRSIFKIRKSGGKTFTLLQMAGKYIIKDLKTSCFAALTICLGITLFVGLVYWAGTLKTFREDTKDMNYLNGEYTVTMLGFDSIKQGVSRQDVEEIKKIDEVALIKTASGLPIRVIDEDNRKRNDEYYDKMNRDFRKYRGYSLSGHDGTNQVFQSMLYGYNTKVLEQLQKYVVSGNFDPLNIKDDEIILMVLRMDDKNNKNQMPGFYKEGTPLMQYKAGDTIKIKYRKDLETGSLKYLRFNDTDAEYIYKTYKVAAVVSFSYMEDYNKTIYPMLITSDSQIQKIAPDSGIQCMYIDGKRNMDTQSQDKLEQHLINICSQNNDVIARSMVYQIEQNKRFYQKQMVYVYGMAVIVFVLVMINMLNNLKYRMQTRTREICMLRAAGMSVAMVKEMMIFENITLGLVAIIVAFFLSFPITKYLYNISDMYALGHSFKWDYTAFSIISLFALAICALLSLRILEPWKAKQIAEGIGKFE